MAKRSKNRNRSKKTHTSYVPPVDRLGNLKKKMSDAKRQIRNDSDILENLMLQRNLTLQKLLSILNPVIEAKDNYLPEFQQSEIEDKVHFQKFGETPQETISRAFNNAAVLVGNENVWRVAGFNKVPETFDSPEEKIYRFMIFFIALDYTIALSEKVLAALENQNADNFIAPFLFEPCENPAQFMARYIVSFNKDPFVTSPMMDYKRFIERKTSTVEFYEKYYHGTYQKLGKDFDELRRVFHSIFTTAKNEPLTDYVVDQCILGINQFFHIF